MKKLSLLIVSLLVSIVAQAAVGDTFSVGNLSYKVTYENTSDYSNVYVKGLSAAGKASSSLALIIPSTVTYNGNTYYVKEVESSAFEGQTNITSVTVRYGNRAINESAFKNCTNISYVRLPSSMTGLYSNVFAGCTKLKTVYFANPNPTYGSFNRDVFPSNTGMVLYVPKTNANSVEKYKAMTCFKNFTTIKKESSAYDFYFSDGAQLCVTTAPTKTTPGEMTLVGFNGNGSLVKEGVLNPSCGSGQYIFENLGYNLTVIADSACMGNEALKGIDFSRLAHIIKIGYDAFSNSGLTSVNINTSALKTISKSFCNTSITEITIPAGVISCSKYFVDGCTRLKSITVDQNNSTYSSYGSLLFDKSRTTLLRCPQGYEAILGTFFDSEFPKQIKTISSESFKDCKLVKKVYLPYGVTRIESSAFLNCTNMGSIFIPSTVSYWGSNIFYNNTSLSEVSVNAPVPPVVSSNEFYGAQKATLRVPYTSQDAYKVANVWKTFGTVTNGSFDYGPESDVHYNHFSYTIHSTKPEVINGVKYDGRARLSYVLWRSGLLLIKVHDYIEVNGKKYAVTAIDSKVCVNSFSEEFRLTLGENVDSIYTSAFEGVGALKELHLNSKLRYIGESAFYNCLIGNDIDLPYGIETVGDYAFAGNFIPHFLIPSSIKNYGTHLIDRNPKLQELIVNKAEVGRKIAAGLTLIPSTCKVYIPMGTTSFFSANEWKSFSILLGAHDFTADNQHMDNTLYHITVTSGEPFTKDGVTYAGKAKYVYHPANAALKQTKFTFKKEEPYTINGANDKYLMVELSDSVLIDATTMSDVSVEPGAQLERIGNYALYGSGLRLFTIPKICQKIGTEAFYNCKSLKEILDLTTPGNAMYWSNVYGNNASDFTYYISWQALNGMKNLVNKWSVPNDASSSVSPVEQLAAYIEYNGGSSNVYNIGHSVDWAASGLKAYYVTSYDDYEDLAKTTQVNFTSADKAVLVTDLEQGEIYKLHRPNETFVEKENLLVPTFNKKVDVCDVSYAYAFDPEEKYFAREEVSGYTVADRYSGYLKLDPATVFDDNLYYVYVDLFYTPPTPDFKTGDVNGDGKIDVADINILIDIILNLDDASKYSGRADVNGDTKVDVADINQIIDMIL